MADLSDVEDALVTTAAAALAPIGILHRAHRGWPAADRLDADLRAGTVTVTVYPMPGATRNTTRYATAPRYDATPVTLALLAAGGTVTVSGTPSPAHVAAVAVGAAAYHRRCLAGDTTATVAAGLAALIPGATAAGATLSIPGTAPIQANAVADWHARSELRRQEQMVQVIVWAPTPALRDLAAGAVDVALSTGRLPLPGGVAGRLRYVRTASTDEGVEAVLYRRDLVFSVEYPTTAEAEVPAVASITRTLAPEGGSVVATRVTVTPT